MVRTRKVDTADILDAAERVVLRAGAGGLSLDAVAKEAGISKSRVVYDYKSKTALLEAIVDRQMSKDRAELSELVKQCANTPHPELYARIKQAEQMPDEDEKSVCLAISGSLSTEATVHDLIKKSIDEDFEAMEKGKRPRAACVAHMALVGFCCFEWFGFRKWSQKERSQMMQDVETVYTHFPNKDD